MTQNFFVACLFIISYAVICTAKNAPAQLYGCKLPGDASEKQIVAFQACVMQANGVKTGHGNGGRWGRSLRRWGSGGFPYWSRDGVNTSENKGGGTFEVKRPIVMWTYGTTVDDQIQADERLMSNPPYRNIILHILGDIANSSDKSKSLNYT